MPYDNETGEFWLNEEEKAWVAAHEGKWRELTKDHVNDLRRLGSRVKEFLDRERVKRFGIPQQGLNRMAEFTFPLQTAAGWPEKKTARSSSSK